MDGQTVEFSDSDYNVHPQLPFAYVNMPATDAAAFLESSTRGFRGNSEFDYFDVKRWAYANLVAGTDTSTIEVEDYVSSKFFYAVHGNPNARRVDAGDGYRKLWRKNVCLLVGER